MPWRDSLALAAVVILWGANFSAAKMAIEQIPPLAMLALRFGLLVIILGPFLVRRPKAPFGRLLVAALCLGGFHFGLLMTGLSGTDASAAAIVIQLAQPFSALLAWAVYREVPRPLQGAGMLLAFAGVYILADSPRFQTDWLPLLIVAAAAFAWALANILIQRIGAINVFELNAWVAAIAMPVMLGMSLLLESGQAAAIDGADAWAWGAIGFQVVGSTIVAYGCWYWLLGRHSVNRLVPIMLLVPVLGVLITVPVLGEPLSWAKVLGGLLTILGVAVMQVGRRRTGSGP